MRETRFIEQNRKKWLEYEQMLKSENMDPDRLNELFVHITDDLSYARTYYPNRSVRAYLNNLASRVFRHISSREPFPMNRLKRFWTTELPQIVWESRKALLLSFALFAISFLIGVLSCTIDPEFPRVVLGDAYVDMTLKNIASGDAMAVYKDRDMFGMSGYIAVNNLLVAFFTMILGMLASIGTVYIMLYNGVMIGAFQYLFVQQDRFRESFLTIWIHGTLEVSAIIIAGGAGLVAGSGWLFPGTYTRFEAFKLSMVRGIKLYLGIIPFIILAAIFEGYLTRATHTPDIIRALFIGINLCFALWYFVWYPWRVARRQPDLSTKKDELPASQSLYIDTRAIKSAGQIFHETIQVFLKHFSSIGGVTALLSAAFTGLFYLFWMSNNQKVPVFYQGILTIFEDGFRLLGLGNYGIVTWLHVIFLTVAVLWGYRAVHREITEQLPQNMRFNNKIIAAIVLAACLAGWTFLIKVEWALLQVLLVIYLTPVLLIYGYSIYAGFGFTAGIRLISGLRTFIVGFYISLFACLLFLFLETPVYSFLVDLVSSNTELTSDVMTTKIYTLMTVFFVVWFSYLFFSVTAISALLNFYTTVEEKDANSLFESIPNVGSQKRIRGLMKE